MVYEKSQEAKILFSKTKKSGEVLSHFRADGECWLPVPFSKLVLCFVADSHTCMFCPGYKYE